VHVNLSTSERWVRGVAGLFAVFLGTITAAAAPWATLAWVGGGALLLTAAAGYCPIYALLGFNGAEQTADDDHWGGRDA
jgi:hypothetical protein